MAVLKVALIALMLAAVVVANSVDADVEVDEEGRPRKGRKLVSPRVLKGKAMMKKQDVIIVPKGDPRARAPTAALPVSPVPTSGPILKAGAAFTTSAACAAKNGQCIETAACGARGGSLFRGVCPGVSVCCLPAATTPATPAPVVDANACPYYAGVATTNKAGNGGVSYPTVPIKVEHLVDPSKLGMSDQLADNTMRQPTACAFGRMYDLAKKAGVTIKIASGFRSYARQLYFWNCYQTKKCNGGNTAARPGNSNHGVGLALDLNTDCGKQPGSRAPAACKSSAVYTWLVNNWRTHGFVRTVPNEPWHWEHRPGTPLPAYANF